MLDPCRTTSFIPGDLKRGRGKLFVCSKKILERFQEVSFVCASSCVASATMSVCIVLRNTAGAHKPLHCTHLDVLSA